MATNVNTTQIIPPRVPIIDERTGAVSREWYRWFYNVYTITGEGLGVTPVINGGTGLSTIPTNGQLLIGNGTGYDLNTLATGSGISVTNGVGTITLANTGVLSFTGGATGLSPTTATTGAVTLGGILNISNGGTFSVANPTAGAIAYGDGSAYKFTAVGTAGQLLTSAGAAIPTWSNIADIAVTSLSFGTTGLTPSTATKGAITVAGTLAVANGGTGLTSTPANGALDIGNGTGFTRTTLTAGSGVSITNGAGSISISATGTGGTVTSVSFTGGIVTVATPTTTPALTVAGTSGGIPYFSSGTTWASSSALAANAIVLGGGAGAAPATTTTGTGVVTALGVNTGTAGSFVVNGGALGTPSSGTVTNLTGTASININGTVGATTPAAGTFTSISSSGNLTFTGTGNRITGDFTSALTSRVLTQTNTVNSSTNFGIIPNGTATSCLFAAFNNSTPANSSVAQLWSVSTEISLRSAIAGTGTYLPLTFYTNNSERVRIDTSGKVGINVVPVAGTDAKLQVTGGTTNATTLATAYSAASVVVTPKSTSGYSLAVASGTSDFPQLQVSAAGAASGDLLIQPYGGNVGIGGTANASAILDAQSTTKGVRFPNMTTAQKNAIGTPAAGLVVFDTTLAKLCVYSGAAWETITSI
jgi:hypothetical protein